MTGLKTNWSYQSITLWLDLWWSLLKMLRHTQRRSWRIILCIRNHATFEDLITFSRESIVGGGNTYKGTVTTCHASHKLPDFKVPHFNDETIEGQDLVKSVERTFKSHALSMHLTDPVYCEAHLEWFNVLALCIREKAWVRIPLSTS